MFLVTLGPKLPGMIHIAVPGSKSDHFTAAAIRVVATWLIESAMGDNIFATLLRAARYKSVGEYTAFSEQKDIYEKLFYEEVRQLRPDGDTGLIIFVGRFGTSKILMA